MDSIGLAVIGGGSVRCAVPIVASLATYFGERPLEIVLFDADEERLDLFDRLARACFGYARSTHALRATVNAAEALEAANRVVLALDENCAKKHLLGRQRSRRALPAESDLLATALRSILRAIRPEAEVLSLLAEGVRVPSPVYYRLDWPDELTEGERAALPHQVLRWLKSDEPLYPLLDEHQRSPLKAWLDDVRSATLVSQI